MASDEIHWPNFRPPTFFFPPPQSTKKSSYDLNGKIMLAAIISLSVVVLLVLLLHIYARWLLRRQAQRRAAMRRLGLMVAHGPSSTELVTPKTGLDPSVIALLSMFAFKQPDQARDSSSPTEAVTSTAVLECAVCLSVLEDGEMVRVLPKCKHVFHVECIDMWLGSHATCPLCRAEAQPEQPGPDEPTSEPVSPAAPPVERVDSSVSGVDDGSGRGPGKSVGSGSRLSSFRRMLSRETSSRRIQPDENVGEDIERQ